MPIMWAALAGALAAGADGRDRRIEGDGVGAHPVETRRPASPGVPARRRRGARFVHRGRSSIPGYEMRTKQVTIVPFVYKGRSVLVIIAVFACIIMEY